MFQVLNDSLLFKDRILNILIYVIFRKKHEQPLKIDSIINFFILINVRLSSLGGKSTNLLDIVFYSARSEKVRELFFTLINKKISLLEKFELIDINKNNKEISARFNEYNTELFNTFLVFTCLKQWEIDDVDFILKKKTF